MPPVMRKNGILEDYSTPRNCSPAPDCVSAGGRKGDVILSFKQIFDNQAVILPESRNEVPFPERKVIVK